MEARDLARLRRLLEGLESPKPAEQAHRNRPAENPGAPVDGYILVVDDDADFRALLAESLQAAGWPVEEAENGQAALNRLGERLPALVLLDLKMPVMDGWSVLEALRDMPRARAVLVLVISAYGYEWEAELIGADGFVGKPVDLEQLRHRVEALIGPPRAAVFH